MKRELFRAVILGGAVGGISVALLAYVYLRYKIATFPGTGPAQNGVPVTIPGSVIAGWVADIGHGV